MTWPSHSVRAQSPFGSVFRQTGGVFVHVGVGLDIGVLSLIPLLFNPRYAERNRGYISARVATVPIRWITIPPFRLVAGHVNDLALLSLNPFDGSPSKP